MNILFPPLESAFLLKEDKINIIVIENPQVLYSFLNGLYYQCNRYSGDIVLSDGVKVLDVHKNIEFVYQLIPFEQNKKTLLTKLQNKLRDIAYNDLYVETMDISAAIQQYLIKLVDLTDFELDFNDVSISDLLKSSGVKFSEEYRTLSEKIFEYFNSVINLEGDKLFVLYNYRSLVGDEEYKNFIETCIGHKVLVLLVENVDRPINSLENIVRIDKDMCVI